MKTIGPPRALLRAGVAVGTLLTCAPLLGMLGALFGMMPVFRTLGESGIGDPRPLAAAIGGTLLASASGLFLFPLGIVLLVVCLWLLRRSRGSEPPPRFLKGFARNSEE